MTYIQCIFRITQTLCIHICNKDWLWTDGTLFDFKPWMSGEPNNWNNIEHCARFRANDRTFSDVRCSFKLPFICKVQKGIMYSFIKINYFHVLGLF